MLLKDYDGTWGRLLGRSNFNAVISNAAPYGGHEIPTKLEVGQVWHGQVTYNQELAERALAGNLCVGIACSHRRREYMKRVKLPSNHGLAEIKDS